MDKIRKRKTMGSGEFFISSSFETEPALKPEYRSRQSLWPGGRAGWTWGGLINHGAGEWRFPDNFDELWRVVFVEFQISAFCQKTVSSRDCWRVKYDSLQKHCQN